MHRGAAFGWGPSGHDEEGSTTEMSAAPASLQMWRCVKRGAAF